MEDDVYGTEVPIVKPYHSKRAHHKSRGGCANCRRRRVKCGEQRPSCQTCVLRNEECVYRARPAPASSRPRPEPRPRAVSHPGSSSASASGGDSDATPADSRVQPRPQREGMLWEPEIRAPSSDEAQVDMKLLWFYTTKGYDSFSINTGRVPEIDTILQVKIPQHAFGSPFLMNCLHALSSLNMRYLGQDSGVSAMRALTYRARATEGYRRAIEEARPETFPALLACSLLLCALSTEGFREPDARPFYVLDWMVIWRGIGLVVDIIKPQALFESGMAMLFVRPPVDLDEASRHIPGQLMHMVTSLEPDDEEYPLAGVYHETLRLLGALYMDLRPGYSPISELRIATFFTFLPQPFVEAARRKRPRALVVIAYWLAFAKMAHAWWMAGISNREIRHICNFLGPDWASVLRVPQAVARLDDLTDIGRVLFDDQAWELSYVDFFDLSDAVQPAIINNEGQKVQFSGPLAKYSLKAIYIQDRMRPAVPKREPWAPSES